MPQKKKGISVKLPGSISGLPDKAVASCSRESFMAFFSPSSRSLTRDDIRVVSLRRLAAPGLALMLVLSLGSFAGGIWVGGDLRAKPEVVDEEESVLADEGQFAIARVGEVVGRLKSLESDLLALQRMMDEQRELHGQLSALDPTLLDRKSTRLNSSHVKTSYA